MPRNDRERLEDALGAARAALAFAAGLSLADLQADARTLAALKYELLVLGESLGRVGERTRQKAPELPWAQIRGLRNVITHEYFRVSPGILHQVVTVDLPALVPALEALIQLERGSDV